MIIDSHVHISLYNDNAKTLQGAFDLLLSEMEKNRIGSAIIIPDNIEGSDSIADLGKAIELIGDQKTYFFWVALRLFKGDQASLKSTKIFWKKARLRG